MQGYKKINPGHLKVLLALVAILFIAYLPVASLHFALKNDAYTGYFPPKYLMSKNIAAGVTPLWNPYINLGYPQYGDMSSGYWSPVTWVVASVAGYNPYSFTIELLLYLLVAGAGMLALCSLLQIKKNVAFLTAASYMCCGYMVGHLQHFNWVSGAAFLPGCVAAYLILLRKFTALNVLVAVLMFTLLITSAHPGIIIGAMYLFLAMSVAKGVQLTQSVSLQQAFKKILFANTLLLLVLIIVLAPMLWAYAEVLPHLTRGTKISMADALLHPTNVKSWMSFLTPLPTVKANAYFATDISMRNCYIGLLPFAGLLLTMITQKTGLQKFLLITGFCFLLLATGGFFKQVAYYTMPLIGYVRLNGEFTIFSLLCFLVSSAITLNRIDFSYASALRNKLSTILLALLSCCSILFVVGLVLLFRTSTHPIFDETFFVQAGISAKAKYVLDQLSFWQLLCFQTVQQFLFLLLIRFSLKRGRINTLMYVAIVDVVLSCLLFVPFTGVGKVTNAELQAIYERAEKHENLPVMISPDSLQQKQNVLESVTGSASMYNGEINYYQPVAYPIQLANAPIFFDSIQRQQTQPGKGWAHISQHVNAISLVGFKTGHFIFDVNIKQTDTLRILQNYYPGWQVLSRQRVLLHKDGLMQIPLQSNDKRIEVFFKPAAVIAWLFYAKVIACIFVIVFLVFGILHLFPFHRR